MLPPHASATQTADGTRTRIGVGIDTSRYGHYACNGWFGSTIYISPFRLNVPVSLD
jgi:hypothetical protein